MIKMILAIDENNLLGNSHSSNGLAWHHKEDLKHFKETTLNKTIIYGRKTFELLGKKPLPKRENIVVSRTLKDDHIKVVNDLTTFLNTIKDHKEDYYICGGASIYEQAIAYVDEIILSKIPGKHHGDVYFNSHLLDNFKLVREEKRSDFTIVFYERK